MWALMGDRVWQLLLLPQCVGLFKSLFQPRPCDKHRPTALATYSPQWEALKEVRGTCTEIINLRALNHSHFHPSAQEVQMNPAGYCALFGSLMPSRAWEGVSSVSDLAFVDGKTSRRCSWKACSLFRPIYCKCAHFVSAVGCLDWYRQKMHIARMVQLHT